jgi:hypothetical protein
MRRSARQLPLLSCSQDGSPGQVRQDAGPRPAWDVNLGGAQCDTGRTQVRAARGKQCAPRESVVGPTRKRRPLARKVRLLRRSCRAYEVSGTAHFGPLPTRTCATTCPQLAKADAALRNSPFPYSLQRAGTGTGKPLSVAARWRLAGTSIRVILAFHSLVRPLRSILPSRPPDPCPTVRTAGGRCRIHSVHSIDDVRAGHLKKWCRHRARLTPDRFTHGNVGSADSMWCAAPRARRRTAPSSSATLLDCHQAQPQKRARTNAEQQNPQHHHAPGDPGLRHSRQDRLDTSSQHIQVGRNY